MPIITSRYWNMVHGTNPEEVKQDIEGMQTMKVLGNNMEFLFLSYPFLTFSRIQSKTIANQMLKRAILLFCA